MIYDLIIIGMGVSGMSAAIYAKRNGMNVLILEKNAPGGLINTTSEIENYLGFSKINGSDLVEAFLKHIQFLQIPYQFCEVLGIELNNDQKKVKTSKETFLTKNIYIATGRLPRKLGLPNEDKLLGKGLSYCATCDGAFFKAKTVAVVGGGSSALEEALFLSNICEKVYLIHRRLEFKGEEWLIKKVQDTQNIEIIYESEVSAINEANGFLSGINLTNQKELKVAGLFINIGFIPKLTFNKDLLATTEDGYIIVDAKYQTNIEGIYAGGDIIKQDFYQIITAASDGAKAVLYMNQNN